MTHTKRKKVKNLHVLKWCLEVTSITITLNFFNFSIYIFFSSIFGWIASGLTRKPGSVSGYNDYHIDPQGCLLCAYS